MRRLAVSGKRQKRKKRIVRKPKQETQPNGNPLTLRPSPGAQTPTLPCPSYPEFRRDSETYSGPPRAPHARTCHICSSPPTR